MSELFFHADIFLQMHILQRDCEGHLVNIRPNKSRGEIVRSMVDLLIGNLGV